MASLIKETVKVTAPPVLPAPSDSEQSRDGLLVKLTQALVDVTHITIKGKDELTAQIQDYLKQNPHCPLLNLKDPKNYVELRDGIIKFLTSAPFNLAEYSLTMEKSTRIAFLIRDYQQATLSAEGAPLPLKMASFSFFPSTRPDTISDIAKSVPDFSVFDIGTMKTKTDEITTVNAADTEKGDIGIPLAGHEAAVPDEQSIRNFVRLKTEARIHREKSTWDVDKEKGATGTPVVKKAKVSIGQKALEKIMRHRKKKSSFTDKGKWVITDTARQYKQDANPEQNLLGDQFGGIAPEVIQRYRQDTETAADRGFLVEPALDSGNQTATCSDLSFPNKLSAALQKKSKHLHDKVNDTLRGMAQIEQLAKSGIFHTFTDTLSPEKKNILATAIAAETATAAGGVSLILCLAKDDLVSTIGIALFTLLLMVAIAKLAYDSYHLAADENQKLQMAT